MNTDIVLIHLSDLHMSEDDLPDIELRLKALLKDIENLQPNPALLIFSGDVAFSGKKIEYELAHEHLFDAVKRRLHLNFKKMLIVPGNHDVDQARIDAMREGGLATSLTNTEIAQEYLNDPQDSQHDKGHC